MILDPTFCYFIVGVGSTHEDLVEKATGSAFYEVCLACAVLVAQVQDSKGNGGKAFNWFEDWKGIHIIWYYRPHAVPEGDRKYLPKDSNWKLNS